MLDAGSTPDRDVRALVRTELPAELFESSPRRALLFLPTLALIGALSWAVVRYQPPWYLALAVSVALGHLYARLMFFAHDVGHGATVRVPWQKALLSYPCCAIFLLSPHLWAVWHNQVHHAQTAIVERDPDNFGTLDEYRRNTGAFRFAVRIGPGGGRLFTTLFFLFTFFTLQAQCVLWFKSYRLPGFGPLRRARAALDSLVMLAFWIALGVRLGAHDSLFVIGLPMLVANYVVLSYVSTNHMLSPLADGPYTVKCSLSITVPAIVDVVHLWFSHHIEHHLFPSMPSCHYPRVREVLRRHFGEAYLAPRHWRALLALLETGRVYDGPDALLDPFTGRRTSIQAVQRALRGAGPLESTRADMETLLRASPESAESRA